MDSMLSRPLKYSNNVYTNVKLIESTGKNHNFVFVVPAGDLL